MQSNLTGCNDVILMVTDGFPSQFDHLIREWNRGRKTRVFVYLIGDESTAFEDVQDWQCFNIDFVAQVATMYDVPDKVLAYVRSMAHTLERQRHRRIDNVTMWSGVYMDRLVGLSFTHN